MKSKKLIFLENREQTLYYLNNMGRFGDVVPISLAFEVEEFLAESNIKFKTDDDYETPGLYGDIYLSNLKRAKTICNKLKLEYKKINLFELFYADIFRLLAFIERYSKLLKRILKIEKPKEVYIFEAKNKESIASEIIKVYFKGEIEIINYSGDIPKEKNYIRLIGKIQNIAAKIKLIFSDKKNNIFYSGSKTLFEPLIEGLQRNNRYEIFRCHSNLQKSFVVNRKYVPFYQFSGRYEKDQKQLREKMAVLLEKIRKINFSTIINDKLSHLFKGWLFNLINREFIKIAKIIDEIIYLAKKEKLNLVLLDDTINTFERTLTLVCKNLGIPTIVVQHGLMGGAIPPSSDYILAFGKESKKKYTEFGFPKSRIIITGSPQYDLLIKESETDKNLKKNKKIVYIVDAVNNNELIPNYHLTKKQQKESFRILFRVMKKFQNYGLVIKGRRKWDLNNLANYVAKQENFNNLEFLVETDKIELLKSADIVIIHYTTMGLEAMLFNKPIISLEFKGLEKWNNFTKMKSVNLVYKEKQLETAIRKALNETNKDEIEREKTLNKELYKLDGKSTERAVNFINKLLNSDMK